MAAAGDTWAGSSLRSTSRDSSSEQPDQETKDSGDKTLMTHREVWQEGETHHPQCLMSEKQISEPGLCHSGDLVRTRCSWSSVPASAGCKPLSA